MIDSHIHLYDEQYSVDLEEVVQKAIESGVSNCVVVACEIKDIPKAIELKEMFSTFINFSFGIHPVSVTDDLNSLEELKHLVVEFKPIAIGEIGLDYHWHPEQHKEQKYYFEEQILMAKEFDLPVIIHCREALEDTLDIVKKYAPIKGVIHSFSGNAKQAREFIECGLLIGISGPITFKNGHTQKQCAKEIPLDKILLETDGPYLTPVPHRGKRNRPEYIEFIAQEIAFQKQISIEEVKEQTMINTINLFEMEKND